MEIIEDGRYTWKEVFNELDKDFCVNIRPIVENKDYREIYSDLKLFKEFIYEIVHKKLYPMRDLKGVEEDIRMLIKYVINKLLPYVNNCILELNRIVTSKKREDLAVVFNDYLDLEDDLYALASFRSLYHFAMYMERQDNEADIVWKYIIDDVMGGIFFYSNMMILNDDCPIQNLIKQCPTGYGKCFQENEMVLTSTGYKYAKDVKVNDLVYSMKDNEVVLKRVVDKWYSKKKQIKIKTRNGIEIIVSPEHRMFTQRGYIEAKEITKDDYLYYLCSPLNYGKDIDENEMKFISMMIFDGSCSGENIQFSKPFYTEIYKEFMKVCDELHFGYNNYTCKDRDCNILSIRKNEDRPKELLEKYGLYGYYSTNKRLPQEFFTMSLKQRYEFIGIMLATDGYIPKYSKNGGNNVGITLSNKELCKDIQFLMSTCGIYSNLSYKRSKINEKMFDSWVLTIPDEFIEVIYKNCYCYQKQDSLIERYEYINNLSIKVYSNSVNYPKEVLKDCKEFKKIVNKQWSRNKTFKREIVHKYINDKNIISNDFYWNRIVDIECNNEETTMIDFEIEETHNFILNGLVSHNSKSDCDIICFCFGYNINDDIMKCVGNKNNVKSNIENVTQMMKSERYAKVFPYFAQFKKKDDIFEYCTMGEGKFKIKGSSKPVSFFCFNKDTVIDGLRYNKQFYDDVTQSDDINNITNHLKDRDRYERQWKKRKSNTFTCKSWFTGTSYHKEDFISSIIDGFRDDKPLIRDNSYKKYTWGKFVYTNESRNMVYIKVPKLADLELGEDKCYCTFPQKNSKYEALKDYHRSDSSKRTFMAMEQQSPLPPECFGFDYSLLQQYDDLPQEIKSGDCISRAIIDPTRKGRDNYACLIFKKPIDSENKKWYLTDCYYKKVKPNIALPEICKRLSYHKIDEIYFEENILDEFQMKKIISEYMKEEGWEDYKISSIYSTLKKEDKIEKYMYDIRDNIVFPRQGMYYNDSDMGRAMYDISNYSLDGKNEHDDSIDCCAMLCSLDKKVRKNKIEALKFRI